MSGFLNIYEMKYILTKEKFVGDKKTLKDIINSDYISFVKKLGDNIKDPKFQAILNGGYEDGQTLDEQIKVHMDVSYKAKDLIPTQNQIGFEESFKGVLSNSKKAKNIILNDLSDFNNNRLLIGNGKYILDGHHRWSQIYFLNPQAEIPCINIEMPQVGSEEMMLKIIQLCIASTYNTIIKRNIKLSVNVLSVDVKRSQIRDGLPKIMGDDLTKVCGDAYADKGSFLRTILKLGAGIIGYNLTKESNDSTNDDLLVDVADVTADIAGIFDPTGAIDVAHGLTYLKREEYLMAVCSFISAIPVIGDAIGKPVTLIAKGSKKLMQALKIAVEAMDSLGAARIIQKLGKPFMTFVEKVGEWGPKLIEALEKLKSKYPFIVKFIDKIKNFIEFLKKTWKWVKRILGYFDPLSEEEVWDLVTSNIMLMKKNKPKFGVPIEYAPHPLQTAKFVGQSPETKDGYMGVPKKLISNMKSGKVNFLEPFSKRESLKWLKNFEQFDCDDDLEGIKRGLERRIDDYFGGGQKYSGDQGYQDLLQDLDEVENAIDDCSNKKTIDDYPQSVRLVYNRFNDLARKSINDNPEVFAKIAKKVFYSNKPWKDFFINNKKEVKNINTLSDAVSSLEKWLN